MTIQKAIQRAIAELNRPGDTAPVIINAMRHAAIAYTATDILGAVKHDVLAAVLSAMDEAEPYIDEESLAWQEDGKAEYATQSLAGTERR